MARIKAKTKGEITRVAALASECGPGPNVHIILPRSFLGKRVFAILKDQLDEMKREEQRRSTKTIFTRGLIGSGNSRKDWKDR